MKALTTLLVAGMFLTTVAVADDADDVKAAVQKYITALNTGDANAYVQTRTLEYSSFSGGGLLGRSHSLEEQKNGFQGNIDSGVKLNLRIRHLEVRVYGTTAIATGYTVGTITGPDGTTEPVREQRTSVWIKQGGQWKQAHRHTSPLLSQ